MKKTIVTLTILIPFLVGAVYLCPCKVAFASKNSYVSQSHDCCERMKNCPAPKEKSKGLMSMLSVAQHQDGRVEVAKQLSEVKIDFVDSQLEPAIKIAPSLFPDFHTTSPPELYLKHSILRI